MNSGLMQVMAFLHEKGSKASQVHCQQVAAHLRSWLHNRYPGLIKSEQFEPFMISLMEAQPRDFQMLTTEALAWLKWLRQMAPAERAGR